MIFRAKRAKNYSTRHYYKASFFARPGEVGDLFGYSNFQAGQEIDADFAIIDIETSSLSPNSGHVIEVAIQRMSRDGNLLNSYQTLINPPDGQVGRPDIHKIVASDLRGAPTFEEASGDILDFLKDCVVVAHNAKFEENFLSAEFSRVGIVMPTIPAIDTMWLAQMEHDLINYKLPTVLAHYGFQIENAHTAYGDVLSIAKFLPEILDEVPTQLFPVSLKTLPKVPLTGKIKSR